MYTVPPIFTYAPLGRASRRGLGKPQAWVLQLSGPLPPGNVPWSAARPAGATRLPPPPEAGLPAQAHVLGRCGCWVIPSLLGGSPPGRGARCRCRERVPGLARLAADRGLPAWGGAAAEGAGSRGGAGLPGRAETRPSRPPTYNELTLL